MIILKCDCGNEEDFKDLELDEITESFGVKRKRKEYLVSDSEKFKVKVSKHHKLHIDCLQCGKKYGLYTF